MVIATFYYIQSKEKIKRDVQSNLSEIAEYKTQGIYAWLEDNYIDLNISFNNQIFAEKVFALANNTASSYDEYQTVSFLEKIKENLKAKSIFLSNVDGGILAYSHGDNLRLGEHEFEYIRKAVKLKQSVLCDLHLKHNEEIIALMSFVPVVKNIDGDEKVIGVVTVFLDPYSSLFPLIEKWPVGSKSAESFLVRVEGSQLLFLNELRFQKNTALKETMPLIFLHSGENGELKTEKVFEGVDYRNEQVIAVAKKIPNSDWILIVKIDEKEVYQQVYDNLVRIFGSVFLLIFTIGAVVFLYQKKSKTDFYKKLYETELERDLVRIHFNEFIKNANDVILLCDPKGNIIEANNKALSTYGYTREEFLELNIKKIEPRKTKLPVQHLSEKMRTEGESIFETEHVRKDGTFFPVEASTRSLELEEKRYFQSIIRDISERKEAEKKLRESEEHYRNLFNNNPHPMWVYDLETLAFLEVNDAAVDHYGYSHKDFFSMTLKDIRPSNDIVRLLKNIEETKLLDDKGIDHSGVWQHKKKDGTIIEVEITSHKINYKGKSAKLVLANDITKRRGAERMLQESEEKYRSIFNLAPVGIYQSTMDGRFITVNEKLAQILGYNSKEELLELNMSKDIYFNSEEREKLIARYEPLGSVADLEVCWKKKDGTPIWIQLTARALKYYTSKAYGFEGFVRDISGLKEAETALRENQKLLSTVIETMPVGIWLVDAEGKIMLGNPAAQKIWAGAKYVGIEKYDEYKAWFVSTGKRIGADEWAAARVLKTGKSIINEELEIERFDGEHRFIYNSVVPIWSFNKKIAGVVVVNQDITERKKAEKELIAAKEKAENLDKIKSEFLAQMSHEVRTPLNVLLSFSSDIRDELEEKQQLTKDMEQSFFKINDAGKRIVRTMELILSMSEVQSGSYENNPKQTDIYEILKRLYPRFLQTANKKKLQFDLIKNAEACYSYFDPYAIEQVLDNLIDNAIKFTEEGRVTIYVDNDESGNLTVTVEDTGIGISEEYFPKLYTPFSQEHQGYARRYEGNGLGLALAKKLCDINNVAIEVSSKKGEGTAVTLTFPK